MADRDRERMEALTRANVSLLRRVDELERRVAFLERLGRRPGAQERVEEPAATPAAGPPGEPPAAPPPREPLVQPFRELHAEPPSEPPVEPPHEPREEARGPERAVETSIGLTWVNRIAVFTSILAVAFFFNYAVDNEWIGPGARVLLGVLAGVASIASAELLWRRGHQVYAQGLTGLGIAILYLSFYAGFSFYQLMPQRATFGFMLLVTAAAVAMSVRYSAGAIAALGFLGGFATPLLLSTGERHTWFLLSYVLLLDLGSLALARKRNWHALEWLALTGTVIVYVATLESMLQADEHFACGLFALLYWALFASTRNPAAFYIAHFLAGIVMYPVWEDRLPGYAVTTLLLATVMLVLGDRRNWPGAAPAALVTFAVSWLQWSEPQFLPKLATLIAGFLLLLAWTPWRGLVRQSAITRYDLLVIPLNAILAAGGMYTLFDAGHESWRGFAAVAMAVAHFGIASLLRQLSDARPAALLAGVALALLTVAAPMQFDSYRVTMAWALEGAAIIWIASRLPSRPLAGAGLFVIWIALIRLFADDAWIYSRADAIALLANARFLTFAITAVSLFLASRWWLAAWQPDRILPIATYGAGHFALIWGLGLEVLGWATRTASPENLRNVESASISILIASYAVALAAAGIATRTLVNRVIGLALIGFVVLKLYLYDVWNLRLLYRVLAFSALGGLLLLLSFLYSRTRVKKPS